MCQLAASCLLSLGRYVDRNFCFLFLFAIHVVSNLPTATSLPLPPPSISTSGQYPAAVTYLTKALSIDPEHNGAFWFQREVALYLWSRLDTPLVTFR